MGKDYVPTADSANNVVMSDVVGNKTDTTGGDSLVALTKVVDANVDKLVSRSVPTITSGTLSYLDAGGMQTVDTLTITKATEIYVMFDLNNMTQNGDIFIQSKVDGTNYRGIASLQVQSSQNGSSVGPIYVNTDVQVVYSESGGDEGADRDLPYRIIQITRED